jgi:hypothetical protein
MKENGQTNVPQSVEHVFQRTVAPFSVVFTPHVRLHKKLH